MEPSTLWWIAAGALLAAELITGTFYLLMISTGFAAGGLAAVLGASFVAQLLVGAVISIAATGYWHLRRARQPARAESQSNRDVHLDLGESLHIDHWAEDGTASARYYSFNQGLVHFLVFSAEAYAYKSGAEFIANQLAFMKADLAAVNRSVTPWVVGLVHRDWTMMVRARGRGASAGASAPPRTPRGKRSSLRTPRVAL
jgi:membrane protein implicated in regulation of membrane protease activity